MELQVCYVWLRSQVYACRRLLSVISQLALANKATVVSHMPSPIPLPFIMLSVPSCNVIGKQ